MIMRRHIWRGLVLAVAFFVLTAAAAYCWRLLASVKEVRPTTSGSDLGLTLLPPGTLDWPWWRGINRDNIATTSHPLVQWSSSEGLLWKVAVPGLGHASPVIRGDQIFLFSADDATQEQFLVCLNRDTGESLWRVVLHRGGFMAKEAKNTHASCTPACDGERVYIATANSDAVKVSAVNIDGTIAWQMDAGPYVSEWGYGSSTVIDGSLVYVVGDNAGFKFGRIVATSFLAALRRDTGEIVWRIARPEERSYGTPVVATLAGRRQLIMAGNKGIFSYDPGTGEQLWFCKWESRRTANTPAIWHDCVIATANSWGAKDTICVRAAGTGDVTNSQVVWRTNTLGVDVPSPLVVEDRLYLADNSGLVMCLAVATGKQHWRERVCRHNVFSSPFAAAGNIYLGDEEGNVVVFKDAMKYTLAARNALGEGFYASPVVSGDRLYLRSEHHLWCIGPR
jgi:outer membrane protein assembly factor BamB